MDKGQLITLVVEPLIFDPSHDAHQVKVVHSGVVCYFSGLLPAGFMRFTLCDVEVARQFPCPLVKTSAKTRILSHSPPSWVDMHKMIDGCCGIGGISHGAQAVGVVTTVAVDSNVLMTDLHKKHSGAEVITGDLGDISVIAEAWKKADGAQILSAGFSCQPFSRLGDQRSGNDPRSESLPKALKAAYYLQSKVVLLECVTPAGSDRFVSQCIDHFIKLTGFKKEQIDLHLHDVWPCRRSRTWWLLTDPCFGGVGLQSWSPINNLPIVKCLIPYIARWDPRDELALSLDDAERLAFGAEDGRYPGFMLSSEGVSPTALHAWGSQLRPCPCGCRGFALSEKRLQEKGLFGLLVQSQAGQGPPPCLRHLHPNEALALNGMDCTIDLGLNVRLSLSGVGQIASPLQAAWVLSFLVSKISILRFGFAPFPPETQLIAFRSWLLMKCFSMWPCNDVVVQDKTLCDLVAFWQDYKEIPLTQLMLCGHWPALKAEMISIAAVLDSIICSNSEAVIVSPDIEAPETPWYDQPIADPKCDLCLQVSVSTVTLIDVDGSSFPFGFQAGSTISDVLQAHARLTGPLTVQLVSDDRGHFLPFNQVIEPGQAILVFLSKSGEGEHFSNHVSESENDRDAALPAVDDVDMGPGRPDGIVSSVPVLPNAAAPGESGLLPKLPDETLQADLPSDVKSGALPTCEISPTAVWTQQCHLERDCEFNVSEQGILPSLWGSVQALLGLSQQQFLRLSVPCIGDSAKLLSLRSQVVTINERIQLLDVQQGLWADDEIAFHLKQLVEQFGCLPKVVDTGKAKVCVIDPLLMGAWICGCGYPIEDWAQCHMDVLQSSIQVIGVGRLDTHWNSISTCPLWSACQYLHMGCALSWS